MKMLFGQRRRSNITEEVRRVSVGNCNRRTTRLFVDEILSSTVDSILSNYV